jgi:hypothetical protein
VRKIGDFKVERIGGVPRTGSAVDLSKPPACVLHTTQCSWDAAIAAYRGGLKAPTFQIGPHRIAQLVPLGEAAAALESVRGVGPETNLWARVQVEIVFTVDEKRHRRTWMPNGPTTDVLVALMRFLEEDCDIPLERPFGAEDVLEGLLASKDFKHRRSGKWGTAAGYYGHLDMPENAHWDPGNLDYGELFKRARNVANVRRTLRIALPRMTGDDVADAQRLLQHNRFGNFAPGEINGRFGLLTAQACARAKFALGYPDDEIVATCGPLLRELLSGKRKLPPEFRARRAARLAKKRFKQTVHEATREIHAEHGPLAPPPS